MTDNHLKLKISIPILSCLTKIKKTLEHRDRSTIGGLHTPQVRYVEEDEVYLGFMKAFID